MSACKKSCCWSPFGVCGRRQTCGCHTGHQPIRTGLSPLELERATALTEKKGKRR